MQQGLKGQLSRRQAKYGLNLAVYVLAALAIVVLVNLIANRFVKQIDLTANKRYSLSQQTGKILGSLNRDVDLIYFDRRTNFASAWPLRCRRSGWSRRCRPRKPTHSRRIGGSSAITPSATTATSSKPYR